MFSNVAIPECPQADGVKGVKRSRKRERRENMDGGRSEEPQRCNAT